MQGHILCVGKLKEKYWQAATNEYIKRLGRFMIITITEVNDLPEPPNPSDAQISQIIQKEGEALLSKIKHSDYVIALCIDAMQYTSQDFAKNIQKIKDEGKNICFVIGGSNGLSPEMLKRANQKISLSKLTFPHQIARVLLLEQLYRAEKINANEKYHK